MRKKPEGGPPRQVLDDRIQVVLSRDLRRRIQHIAVAELTNESTIVRKALLEFADRRDRAGVA